MKNFIFSILFLVLWVAPVNAQRSEWKKHDSRYFIIYYKNAPLDFVQTVSRTAEDLYHEIPRNLGFMRYGGWTYESRAAIYIYDDREEYQKNSKSYEWSSGIANITYKEIHTFPAAAGFFDSTLPHELAHLIFREFMGNVSIPLWLDEGVAMYQEKAKRWGANKIVLKAIESGKFIPLHQMTYDRLNKENSEEIINIFYAQAASIVYYMIVELGEARFENFCRKIRDGMPFEEALYSNYGRFRGIEDLNDRWVDYLKSQGR